MQMNRKMIVLMLALVMSVMTLLPACSGGSGSSEGLQNNVTVGKRVFVHEASGVVYFGYKNLICSALMKDGEITEFIPEGGTTGDIHAMAVYGDYLYISASDGFFRYPLSMFTDGSKSGSAEVLLEPDYALSEFNTFEIFDDRIFFKYGTTLACMPVGGGDRTPLADQVTDFEVTDNGIYYTKAGGEMMLMSTDLKEQKSLGSISTIKGFNPGGMNFYYSNGTKLNAFSVQTESSEELGNTSMPSEYCLPWSNGKNVLFYDTDARVKLLSDSGEKEVGTAFDFPLKAFGTMSGNSLLYTTGDYSTLGVYDLDAGTFKSYDLAAEMKDELADIGGDSDTQPQADPGSKTGSGDYNITDGFVKKANDDGTIEYLYFNDFMLVMPGNEKWSYEVAPDNQSVTFYLYSAQQEGYGGRLVTIRAFDIDDNSYEELPSYSVAGVGGTTNKRFVAEFPTDVQWNGNDSTQDADYRDLSNYLHKIGEGAVNSPLTTADSNPEP